MRHRITLITGDGIGPEVTEAVLSILDAAGVAIEWESHLAGVRALEAEVGEQRDHGGEW